ncbi:MAG: hypothetical protein KDC95_08225 [Planctomycetes bacterium]|nr:hypothetical protein [Planctomycetota bacterium]
MHIRTRFLAPAAAFVMATFCGHIVAQALVVDPRGGNGVYKTISAALAVAKHKDTILVQAGDYQETLVIDKGVRILCVHPVRITPVSTPTIGVRIFNIPRGERLIIENMSLVGDFIPTAILATQNRGPMLLRNCSVSSRTQLFTDNTRIVIQDCAGVSFETAFVSGSRIQLARSTVSFTRSMLAGQAATATRPSMESILCEQSSLWLAHSTCFGGAGFGNTPPSAAIVTRDSSIVVSHAKSAVGGTKDALITTGNVTLTIDPGAGLAGSTGGAIVTKRITPTLESLGNSLGSFLQITVNGEPSAPMGLFFGAIMPPVQLAQSLTLWLDPSTLFAGPAITIGLSGNVSWTFKIPFDNTLIGADLAMQSLVVSSKGTDLSNVTTTTLR